MSELPRGWASTTLGKIAETQLGKMLSAKARTGNSGRAYLRNKNVQWGRVDLDDVFHMDFSDAEFEKFRLREGDLLVCEGGEVGRAAIWRGQLPECAYQKALHRVRPRGGVQPEFLLYLFMHYSHARRFDEYVTGSTIKHLPQEDVRLLPVPLPPLAEQRRIVAAIEEQLSRLDAASAATDSARRRIRVFRSRVLVSVIPDPVPDHWRLATVGEAGEIQLGRQRAPRYHVGPNMRPYLRVANVFEDRLDLEDVMQMEFSAEDYERYRLEPGDILLNEGQSPELIGRPAMYRGELPGVCFTNSLIRFRPSVSVVGEFALLVFRRHLHTGRFQREARITTNIAHLSAGRLKSVEFPIPPLEEQREIVRSIDRSLSLIADVDAAATVALRRERSLRRSILASAFRGELVPQDPDDEPASVLLERIAVEGAAAPKPHRKRRVKASA